MAFRTRESIDTNIILRLALRDIPGQCLKIQDMFMRHGVSYDVADLAITEAVYVLQKRNSRDEIVDMLSNVLSMPDLNYNRALFDQVFPMYLEHPKLSFNDCCLTVYAVLNQSEPLWTFDKDLAKQSPTAKMLA